ncbi:hypothetical protein WLX54_24950, partial [Bordetella bronchiseptica]
MSLIYDALRNGPSATGPGAPVGRGFAGAPARPPIEPQLAPKPPPRVEWGDNKPADDPDEPPNPQGFDKKLPA